MKLHTTLLLILTVLTLSLSALADEKTPSDEPIYDLTGRWTVLMSNSMSRKQVTFDLEQKDGRPRGTISGRDFSEQKLDGRLEKGNKVKLWGVYRDRAGGTIEYEFKGIVEGEPGDETLRGEGEFFGRRYDFVGGRSHNKKKS